MRAVLVLVVLCGVAHAELPTIDSEHPPAIRVSSDTWRTKIERVAVAVHSAPETTWLSISVTSRDEFAALSIDVPSGTRVIGLGVTSAQASAWGRAVPRENAFVGGVGGGLITWESTSADEDHLDLRVQMPSTVEIALQLPPLPRLEVAADAGVVSIEVEGEKRFAAKGARARGVVELDDVVGHVGRSQYPAIDEKVALVAIQSSTSAFFPSSNDGGGGGWGPRATRDLDKAMIRRRMKQHKAQLRQCYMAVAQWNPTIDRGGVVLTFMIGADGAVAWAKTSESDLPDSINDCLAEEAKTWEFPATDGAVMVNYPLEFELY